jgi:hypothetical protein
VIHAAIETAEELLWTPLTEDCLDAANGVPALAVEEASMNPKIAARADALVGE